MTTTLDKHGEDKHREIDNVIKKLKFHVDEINLNIWLSEKRKTMKSNTVFLKSQRSLQTWKNYWILMTSGLSLPTNQRMPNSEDCFINLHFFYQNSFLKRLTKNIFINILCFCESYLSTQKNMASEWIPVLGPLPRIKPSLMYHRSSQMSKQSIRNLIDYATCPVWVMMNCRPVVKIT